MIDLILGDCIPIMAGLPGPFDMILADLPYGTTACSFDVVIPFAPLWEQYKRLIKPNDAVLLFGSQPFTSALVMSNLEWFKYCWVWDKVLPTGHLDAKRKPLKYHEDIACFAGGTTVYHPQKWKGEPNHTRKVSTKNRTGGIYAAYHDEASDTSGEKYPRSIIRIPKDHSSVTVHPNQKPVALLEYLIRTYTNEGETVLDNTMGSGSTGVACVNTGRSFVGIEKDAGYFEIAQQRIEKAQTEMVQFSFSQEL